MIVLVNVEGKLLDDVWKKGVFCANEDEVHPDLPLNVGEGPWVNRRLNNIPQWGVGNRNLSVPLTVSEDSGFAERDT